MIELTIFSLSDTIFLRGVRIGGLVDNVIINAKGVERCLNKIKSIIDIENLWYSGILSDNLRGKWVSVVTTSEQS